MYAKARTDIRRLASGEHPEDYSVAYEHLAGEHVGELAPGA